MQYLCTVKFHKVAENVSHQPTTWMSGEEGNDSPMKVGLRTIVQLVEHHDKCVEVTGSSPVCPSNIKLDFKSL